MKYAQRECGPALARQVIDGLLNEAISLVFDQLELRRLILEIDP